MRASRGRQERDSSNGYERCVQPATRSRGPGSATTLRSRGSSTKIEDCIARQSHLGSQRQAPIAVELDDPPEVDRFAPGEA